jgi:hypothetical protein
MTVLAGNEERWKYVLGGPPTVDEERNMLSEGAGRACCGVVEKDAVCAAHTMGYLDFCRAAIARRDAGRVSEAMLDMSAVDAGGILDECVAFDCVVGDAYSSNSSDVGSFIPTCTDHFELL